MATGIYIRVSTVGQNAAGQKKEIEKWLSGNGITDVRWYIDRESGDTLARRQFEKLQRDIFNGEIEAVVCYKLDRLSRSIRDGINTLGDWCERGIRVVSVTQQLDFSGTIGKILAAVFFGLAEMEQETRRERQAIGIMVAKEAGKYIGRQKGTTKAKPDRAIALRAKGLTVDEIATALGTSRRTVHRYLNAEAIGA